MSTSISKEQFCDGQPAVRTPAAFIAFAWTLVGVPLAYGLYQTVKTASSLFTG